MLYTVARYFYALLDARLYLLILGFFNGDSPCEGYLICRRMTMTVNNESEGTWKEDLTSYVEVLGTTSKYLRLSRSADRTWPSCI